MLGKMSEDEAKQYLEQMKLDNPQLYTNVKKYFLSFEDIINMPENIAVDFWMLIDYQNPWLNLISFEELEKNIDLNWLLSHKQNCKLSK